MLTLKVSSKTLSAGGSNSLARLFECCRSWTRSSGERTFVPRNWPMLPIRALTSWLISAYAENGVDNGKKHCSGCRDIVTDSRGRRPEDVLYPDSCSASIPIVTLLVTVLKHGQAAFLRRQLNKDKVDFADVGCSTTQVRWLTITSVNIHLR